MKKGITPIISVIILLLITVALAGMAWSFIQMTYTGLTTKNIVAAGGFCTDGTTANVIIKNVGADKINVSGCTAAGSIPAAGRTCGDLVIARTDSTALMSARLQNVPPSGFLGEGQTITFTDAACTTANNPRTCSYIFTAGSGIGPASSSVTCS